MSIDRDDPAWNGDGTERLMSKVIEQQSQSRAVMINAAKAEAVLAFALQLDGGDPRSADVYRDIARGFIKAQGWSLPAAERTKP